MKKCYLFSTAVVSPCCRWWGGRRSGLPPLRLKGTIVDRLERIEKTNARLKRELVSLRDFEDDPIIFKIADVLTIAARLVDMLLLRDGHDR